MRGDLITAGVPVRLGSIGNGKVLPFRPAQVSPFGHKPTSLGQTAEQDVFSNTLSSIIFDAGGAAVGVISGVKLSGAWSTIGWVVGAAFFLKFMNDLSKIKVSA